MTKITFMTCGDPHFKHNEFYLNRVEEMGQKFIQLCRERKPDFIVNLGDTLHDHRKIDMVAQCKAVRFMRELKNIAPLYVLIGNHDRINNSEFLTDINPFEAMKDWANTFIIDDHVEVLKYNNTLNSLLCEELLPTDLKFFFCPYVPPGRLREALEKSNVKEEEFVLGFAHQEFKGAKMGAVISEEGDEHLSIPVISGHLHDQQMVPFSSSPSKKEEEKEKGEEEEEEGGKERRGDVNYVGTPIGHSHGEHGRKTVSFFTLSTEEIPNLFPHFWCKSKGYYIYEEKIELGVKKLRTLYLDAKAFLTHEFEQGEDPRYYRIIITGKDSDVRLAKKSEKYHEVENLGCRIHFPLMKEKEEGEKGELQREEERKIISYHDAVAEKLKERNDLFKLYQEIIKA